MGNESSSSGAGGASNKICSGHVFILTTQDGILAPCEQRIGFRETAASMLSSFMAGSAETKETPCRPQLAPAESATVTSYACFGSLSRGKGGKIKFGDAICLRFNHNHGACLRLDPSSDKAERFTVNDQNFDEELCAFILHSAQGKAVGTTVQYGDWVTLQSAPRGAHLSLNKEGDTSTSNTGRSAPQTNSSRRTLG